jgi:signal transduction histidine kinase
MRRTLGAWRDLFGLQARMTASYVLVSAASVMVVVAIAIVRQDDWRAGLNVLLVAVPAGGLFGVVSTRGMVKRLRVLTHSTSNVADGDFTQRVIKRSGDELGQLERNFNEMAQRLEAAVSRERILADKSARQAERNRISRELHDSISQELFSVSLLAAGLEKALPQGSPLRDEVHTLAATAEATNREMRALLVELRPASLEEKGLIAALEELASVYSARLGLTVNVDLEKLSMPPAIELAMLRIAQEALANAAKHSRATMISLTLRRLDDNIVLSVTDDGLGFEPNHVDGAEGFGLKHMTERAAELGGKVAVSSEAGKGTIVKAEFPVPTP